MDYKLIAIDMDGTLLNGNGEIIPLVQEAICLLRQRYQIVLATGRHHTTVLPYYQQLDLDTPIICCNGSYLYYPDSEQYRYQSPISKDNVQFFLDQCQSLDLIAYVDDRIILKHTHPANYISKLEQWALTQPVSIRPKIERVDDLAAELLHSTHVWTFVTEGDPKAIDELIALEHVQRAFCYEHSWFNRIGFNNIGNSKGQLLARYLEELAIPNSQVMAIGDNDNDVSMIDVAGLGIALSNATPKLKARANHITQGSNNDSGMLEAFALLTS
ncbi:Cof-type HAD-IIB family hydrolase [Vibrio nomapromontoriensis]|uniref:Cof-type HAD-IIB family hydrolase n=1 Tax=Vibrio nomapromontoriensis TaxID=2910246 RepID=UPI003D0F4A8C